MLKLEIEGNGGDGQCRVFNMAEGDNLPCYFTHSPSALRFH